jgi:ATP-binding cassette subfamily C protein LapB
MSDDVQAATPSDRDALVTALAYLTRHYGRAKSPEALRAGLAYDETGMRPETFVEAAAQHNMRARVVRRPLRSISGAVLPAVLMTRDQGAYVLLGLDNDGATIYDCHQDKTRTVSRAELKKAYTGYAIYVHPESGFSDSGDDGSSTEAEDYSHHWFWSLVRENTGSYIMVIIGSIFINIFALTSPLFIMTVYDRVIPNNAIETGWALAIGAITVYVFDLIMRNLRGYLIDFAGRRIDVFASRRIFDQLMNMKLGARPASSGAFANMLRDFDSVREFMTSATITGLVDLPFSLLFVLIIYLIGGPVALVLLGLMLAVVIIGIVIQIPLRRIVRKSVKSAEMKHGILIEAINGLETIKALGADGRMRARYGQHVGESAAYTQHSRFVSGLGVNLATFLQQIASILIVLVGMYLVKDTELSMGALIACVILGGRALSPLSQVANLMSRYHQAAGALHTLDDFMRQPVERPADKQFLHRPQLEGHIKFDDVSFAYPGTGRDVLKNLSFTINAGEKVAVIGRVGSGKSTVARLIMSLYEPDHGTILIDGTDYRQIDPADLRRNIAYIAQDVTLFRGTVRDNITIARPQADEQEIFKVAKQAGVHDFVADHPMGYDAPVGEGGEGLSGGQRQAVALARAMLLQPNMMVCDEPTNAMDIQAERAFIDHVRDYAQDMTLVLITHRSNLLQLVDRLIVLDKGRVVLAGGRDEVLETLNSGQVQVEE